MRPCKIISGSCDIEYCYGFNAPDQSNGFIGESDIYVIVYVYIEFLMSQRIQDHFLDFGPVALCIFIFNALWNFSEKGTFLLSIPKKGKKKRIEKYRRFCWHAN